MKILVLVLALAAAGFAQQAEAQAAAPKMVKYYMGFLKRGPNYSPQSTPETAEIQKGHLAHLGKMHKMGKLVVAGPFGDNTDIRGILVFRGKDSLEDLKKLAEEDPAVKAGRLVVELHPWYVEENILP